MNFRPHLHSGGSRTSAARTPSIGLAGGTRISATDGRACGIGPQTKEFAMANTLQGKKVAILAADGVERVELETPREAVHDAGGETELLSLKAGEIQARNNDLDSAGTFTVDRVV